MAKTDPAVKAELLAKLGVSPQRLSQLAAKRKGELPMSTPDAVYTIAHENGIDVSKHLSAEETKEIRGPRREPRHPTSRFPATARPSESTRSKGRQSKDWDR